MNMNKKREYTHDDMEKLGEEINSLRERARQLDHDIANGNISHEQWEAAAHELLERKKEIEAILQDVDRYEAELCEEIAHERKLRQEAEAKIAVLEAETKDSNN